MAGMAKLLGVVCLLVAFCVLALACYGFAATDWVSLDESGYAGDVAAGGALFVFAGMFAVAVLFATVGAAAWVVGGLEERQEEQRRAEWDRWRAQQPVERPYGASSRT